MEILAKKYAYPLEREYEAWIVALIEEYFAKIHKKVRIFAISPKDEAIFPADEFLGFDCKIVGIQFKKAYIKISKSKNLTDYSRICWHLSSPVGQFSMIKNRSDIYYCLPTFINRDYKGVALDHCVFWHPGVDTNGGTIWYDNRRANAYEINGNIKDAACRWGDFVEGLYKCTVGTLITKETLETYSTQNPAFKNLFRAEDDFRALISQESDEEVERLYVLMIQLK